MELSGKGLPRPLARLDKKLAPVPWSQDKSWGVSHPQRQEECQTHSLCLLCGRKVYKGVVFAILRVDDEETPKHVQDEYRQSDLERTNAVLDYGPLHERCAALTRAHCPDMKREYGIGYVLRPYRR